MCNLGHNTHRCGRYYGGGTTGRVAVAADLLSESLGAVDDSDMLEGLSILIFSSMLGVEGIGKVPEGNSMSTGKH